MSHPTAPSNGLLDATSRFIAAINRNDIRAATAVTTQAMQSNFATAWPLAVARLRATLNGDTAAADRHGNALADEVWELNQRWASAIRAEGRREKLRVVDGGKP